jgi:predicted nucleic acid-binding protein
MSPRGFLDTNVLLYSISDAPNETDKRHRALELLDRDDCGLSIQVLQEFYVQATRPTRTHALSHETASALIRVWSRFPVQDNTLEILNLALEIRSRYGFSYWDSAIIAAARALGCLTLYSEDMSHGREIAGVKVIDPFR